MQQQQPFPIGEQTMNGNQPYTHGHHQISAALFVGSLILGAAMILSAELTKPVRYEYHATGNGNEYLIYDNDTGRSAIATVGAEEPLKTLEKK
jgi:hypothetical protein